MVDISKLSFGYGKNLLFNDLDLKIKPGHLYGLLGQNGVGKSTFLKVIAGLVFPSRGSCQILGIESSSRQPDTLQNFFFLPEDINIQDISSKNMASRNGSFYKNFDHRQFLNALSEFRVDPDISLAKLSNGQQKKAFIAFALAANTALLLLDEPTNGMDISSKIQFRKIVASTLSEDRSIIISTHQVRDLDNLIDSLLILHHRQMIVDMTLDDISDKLTFSTKFFNHKDILYAEEGLGGLNSITLNDTSDHSKVDTELLFNAIISNNKHLIELFNKSRHE